MPTLNDKRPTFKDRADAASKLAKELSHLRGLEPLILAIPRGAVPIAKTIAHELEGELDIILVRKLGHPNQPEYAIGAVDEAGKILITDNESSTYIGEKALSDLASKQVAVLQKKRRMYTPYRSAVDVRGRTCVLIDDGIATGSTFQAAIRALKEQNAGKIIVAAPVASRQAMELLRKEGVELCVLKIPTHFFSVSTHYENFEQVEDSTVVAMLNGDQQEVEIEVQSVTLKACLQIPKRPKGLVIFAHGSGSGRFSTRNQFVARMLKQEGYATLLADLLTPEEAKDRDLIFDIDFLSQRVAAVIDWSQSDASLKNIPVVLFGASTGAGAAVKAATLSKTEIAAVISRGGRVDLADEALEVVSAPMLFIVGSLDALVLDLNRDAMRQVHCAEVKLSIVDDASHLFEERGALEKVSDLVIAWLEERLAKVEGSGRTHQSELQAKHN